MLWKKLLICLEMIKFEHSLLTLPFAMTAMIWAAKGWPEGKIIFWIIIAMVSCRTASMLFNRLVDHKIDAQNERTRNRALVVGSVSRHFSWGLLGISVLIFYISTYNLNPLAFKLSPIALGIALFYSLTKRFTWMCHFILGISLAIAPMGAWVAVTGEIGWNLWPLFFAVLFWSAGFDILYSLQDEDFDRQSHLFSIPAQFGANNSLWLSRGCHMMSAICFLFMGFLSAKGMFYWGGVGILTLLLIYEQSIVRANDLSRINLAFFTLNGIVSISFFVFNCFDIFFDKF